MEPESDQIQSEPPFHSSHQSTQVSDNQQSQDNLQTSSSDEDTPSTQTTPTEKSDQSAEGTEASLGLDDDVASDSRSGQLEDKSDKSGLGENVDGVEAQLASLKESAPEVISNHDSDVEQLSRGDTEEIRDQGSEAESQNEEGGVARDAPGNQESSEDVSDRVHTELRGESVDDNNMAATGEVKDEETVRVGAADSEDSSSQNEDTPVVAVLEAEGEVAATDTGDEVGVAVDEGEVPSPNDDEMLTFEEFKQKKMEEGEIQVLLFHLLYLFYPLH